MGKRKGKKVGAMEGGENCGLQRRLMENEDREEVGNGGGYERFPKVKL